jgi:hypothetical protein
MSYRDPAAALRTRRDTIVSRLAEARRVVAEAREREAHIAGLEQDLAAVDALLADERLEAEESATSLLDDVRIASPCLAKWDDMIGDDRLRFCGQCNKNVYNLSALARAEAEALLREGERLEAQQGVGLCVRLYRRADGTVLTADCPDGVRRKKRRLAIFGAVGGGLMAAGAAAELFGAAARQGSMVAVPAPITGEMATMGAIPRPLPVPPPVRSPVPSPVVTHPDPRKGGPFAGATNPHPQADLQPTMGLRARRIEAKPAGSPAVGDRF